MQDRLYVSKKVKEKIVPSIDSNKILGLDKSTSERIDLFLYAMSLGVEKGERKELEQKVDLILATAVKSFSMSLIVSVLVDELRKINEIEKIGDQDEAFKVSQEYANAGFDEIESMLEMDEDGLMWKMFNVLDEKYDELFTQY